MYGSVNTDALEVVQPSTKRFVTLRVPYRLATSHAPRMGGSTTQPPDGRGGDCGQASRVTPRGTEKAAAGRVARDYCQRP